jgi:PAS domain S-box-containing protein
MEISQTPLSTDKLSKVLTKLIAETSKAPAGEEGLTKIYKEALASLDAIGVERASILLFDPDGVMRFKAWRGISDSYRKAVEGHTPWTQQDMNPPPLITKDIYEDKELESHFHTFESEDIRGLAFIPLLYRGKVIGKFMLYSRVPYDFGIEVDAAHTIAQLVAYAVVRKKIEESLSRSENRLKAILDNEPECVNLISADGVVLEMNQKGLELIEADSHEEIIGNHFYSLIMEKDRKNFAEMTKKVCNGENDSMEFEIVTLKGNRKFLSTHAVPFFSDEHQKTLLLGITSDVTQRKKSEAEKERILEKEKEARVGAEKSVHQRDEFLSVATHELKTPLTPILMNFQLIKRHIEHLNLTSKEMEILHKVIASTDKQLDRFLKLIENLLDVSRITADRLVLSKENFDLSHLMNEVLEKYKAACKSVGCELFSHIQPRITGEWDKVRIEQVITNLLTNAMKYGVGKPIEVKLELQGNSIFIRMKDHGIGIKKEDREKIFNRFERASSAEYYGGLGLGLFISSNIVSAHGGKISVESELGVGSVFTVELPVYTH